MKLKFIVFVVLSVGLSLSAKSQILLGYSYEEVKTYLSEQYPVGNFTYGITTDHNHQKYISYDIKKANGFPLSSNWYFTTDGQEKCNKYIILCDQATLTNLIDQCVKGGAEEVSSSLYRNEERNLVHQIINLIDGGYTYSVFSFETYYLRNPN